MKGEKMILYMDLLEDSYIKEADPERARDIVRRRKLNFIKYGAFAATFVLILSVLLTVPYWRQSDPALPGGTLNTNESTDAITNPTDSQNPPETHMSPIGGGHMGDELFSPYVGLVDMVVYSEGTFSENYGEYMGEFDRMEGKWENNRPSLMYYLTKTMNLTREDLEAYYASLNVDDVPEDIYVGLLTDSVEESMQLLKSPYAFYNDGKLYTVYDVYNRIYSESPADVPFDATAEEYDQVWLNIDKYLDSPNAYDVGDGIRKMVDEMVCEYRAEGG